MQENRLCSQSSVHCKGTKQVNLSNSAQETLWINSCLEFSQVAHGQEMGSVTEELYPDNEN